MTYNSALEKVFAFIEKPFKGSLADDKPILYIDGRYGVGKSHLGNEIIKKYSVRNKSSNDRKENKSIRHAHFKISLAGATNINEVNKSLSKGVKSLFSILNRFLILLFGGIPFFLIKLFKSIENNEISFNLFYLLKIKSLFYKVIIVVDELDRKCDSLDLNSVFALLSSIADKNVRVIIIGDTNGITNKDEKMKTISYRDKICADVITITEPSIDVIGNVNYLKKFNKSRFPRIKEVTKNVRVISKAQRTLKQIGKNLNTQQALAVEYILLCYYQNLEDGYFIKTRQKLLSPIINQQNNSTILISEKFNFALNEYLKRQYLVDDSIIAILICDGTFNLRQIPTINEIFNCIINLDELNIDKNFKAITANEATTNKNVISCLNKTRTFTTANPNISEFTCDLLFCLFASEPSYIFHNGLSNFNYPIDFRAFIAPISNIRPVNSFQRNGFEQHACLE